MRQLRRFLAGSIALFATLLALYSAFAYLRAGELPRELFTLTDVSKPGQQGPLSDWIGLQKILAATPLFVSLYVVAAVLWPWRND